jgi:hypothetical protein
MDRLKVLINSSTPVSEDCVTDVLEAKKALLKRSEMLEFVDATTDMASVGGLDNLKNWLGSEEIPGTPKPSSSASTHRRASSF